MPNLKKEQGMEEDLMSGKMWSTLNVKNLMENMMSLAVKEKVSWKKCWKQICLERR
uniref:Uncharacterized protein n=1 Tax=Anguilla anguilla TaxID=7936 RepID=A0A0E9WJG9_ANGAN